MWPFAIEVEEGIIYVIICSIKKVENLFDEASSFKILLLVHLSLEGVCSKQLLTGPGSILNCLPCLGKPDMLAPFVIRSDKGFISKCYYILADLSYILLVNFCF